MIIRSNLVAYSVTVSDFLHVDDAWDALMKLGKIPALLMLLLALLFGFQPPARAQIVQQFTLVTATNWYPVLLNYGYQSNLVWMPFIQHSLQVTNIFTNEQLTLNYGAQPPGQSPTNPYVMGTIVTNFNGSTGWTNFPATWTYVIPATGYYAPLMPWASFGISSNGQSVLGTNGVVFQ